MDYCRVGGRSTMKRANGAHIDKELKGLNSAGLAHRLAGLLLHK